MQFIKFKHEHVNENGSISEDFGGGAVHTTGNVIVGCGQGCGLERCHCSDGYWVILCMPRTEDGVVEGIKVVFSSEEEMENELINKGKYIQLGTK